MNATHMLQQPSAATADADVCTAAAMVSAARRILLLLLLLLTTIMLLLAPHLAWHWGASIPHQT